MSNFMSGGAVDCGPSTALKDVSSLVERDYGVQRDRYVPQAGSSAGPSAFRTRPGASQSQQAPAANAFDVSQLRSHLPAGPVSHGPMMGSPVQKTPRVGVAAPAPQRWADTFPSTASAKGKARAEPSAWGNEFASQSPAPQQAATPSLAPWQRPAFMPSMAQQPMFVPPPMVPTMHANPQFKPVPPIPTAMEPQVQRTQPQQTSEPQQQRNPPQDELARTAQALVEQLGTEHGTNEKLNSSQFVQLLRGLGEGSVVVQDGSGKVVDGQEDVTEGAKFVSASNGGDWASAFLDAGASSTATANISGEQTGLNSPNYEVHPPTLEMGQDAWAEQFQAALTMSDGNRNKSVHFSGVPRTLDEARAHQTANPTTTSSWEERMEEDDDDFDTEALQNFNGPKIAEAPQTVGDIENWTGLQTDWEQEFGDETEQPYLFHSANPYALGSPIVREMSPTTMGLLELEAAVQQDPTDASAWLALGLKQQENEREDAAIRALAKAVQLAPETRAAYLALAVSYTNEGRDANAHAALEKWIELGSANGMFSQTPDETQEERQMRIVNSLIDIARQSPDDLDADVQVALGVLFNASEDYSKAEDCFLAALEARPDDWVLYNRLGATLANSGRSHEAIKYYQRALALHPNFVRAQFNLGISYINLAQYRLAAQCVLDAIRLQHSDVTEGYGAESAGHYTKGVTSDALWTTLRMACLHLQRPDLVTLANHHDLSGFPLEI